MKKQNLNPFTRMRTDVPDTNSFDLSFDNKLTCDMGGLYPVYVEETLPGDYFKITPSMLMRFAPMLFPIMHMINAFIHFFYVPNRILWRPWEDYLKGESFVKPFIQGTEEDPFNIPAGSFFDYLGLPSVSNLRQKVDALPLMAYLSIYNEYYQDQNNDPDYPTTKTMLKTLSDKTGALVPTDIYLNGGALAQWDAMPIMLRAWEHDYLTSALPFSQKGPSVNIPITLGDLTGTADVNIAKNFDGSPWAGTGTNPDIKIDNTTDLIYANDGTTDAFMRLTGSALIDGDDAELTGTINQLRAAWALQRYYETIARAGTRYNELIKAQWGVDIGDARISRPEYIGGIKNNIVISEVLQTSQNTEDSSLGDFGGHATGVVGGNQISYACKEHGWVIGILSVLPKTAYYQNLPKKFSRQDHLDYMNKQFAHIGEQEILQKEVCVTDDNDILNDTFGYIPRYSEYKFHSSEVHGDMRTTLLPFHLARRFTTEPALNSEFIYAQVDKRIFAVTAPDVNSLYAHIFFDVQAKRKIPFFTDPAGL